MALADMVTEDEALGLLRRWADDCCTVCCEEGQAVRLAAAVARERVEAGLSVVVAVPNGNACRAMRRQLGAAGSDVAVITIADLSLQVLDRAAERAGMRPPTVLDAVQQRLLMEDMKVLGGKPRRIEEIVRFLCRGVTEFAYEGPAWLISDEERSVLSALGERLRERNALLPSFLAAAACAALEDTELAAEMAVDELVAVGLSAFDNASQIMVGRLADRLVAFGNAEDAGVPEISFPHPAGLELWASHTRSFSVAPSPSRLTRIVSCADDLQEKATVAHLLSREDYADVPLTVTAPTRRWAASLHAALAAAGLDAALYTGPALAKADPRRAEKDDAVRAYALLALAAEPRGTLARRTWLGIGDWLGGSDLWEAVRQTAARQGRDVDAVLDDLAAGDVPRDGDAVRIRLLSRAAERLAEGASACAALEGLEGSALVEAFGAGAAGMREVLAPAPGDDAGALLGRLRAAMIAPDAPDARVVVALADQAAYLVADGVVATGIVDGLASPAEAADPSTPLDVRDKLVAEAAGRLATVERLGEKFSVLTCFTSMGLLDASEAGVDIKRIYVDRGRHRARCAPSVLIKDKLENADRRTDAA